MGEHGGGEDDIIRDETVVIVEELATNLEKKMSEIVSTKSHQPCIFRVPNILLRHNPKAYLPNAFSFGPFHHNEPHLKATQKIKLEYLHGLLSRGSPHTNPKALLRDLTASITEIQEEARMCYDGSIDMSLKELVEVLVLDGCFLIEFFRKSCYDVLRKEDDLDPMFTVKCMNTLLYSDLILLENQIPWLVLDRLFNMTMIPDMDIPLNKLVSNFFGELLSIEMKEVEEEFEHDDQNEHILDLLRNSIIFPSRIARSKEPTTPGFQQMPSATSLKEAGIKLEKFTGSSNILDIEFDNIHGVLKIPPILIQDVTESLFRNLICLEQCIPNCEDMIVSYASLLDNLINTNKDIELLCKKKIIHNMLDIEDATVFFNKIVNDTNMTCFHYHELVANVNRYCCRKWPRYRTVLMHDYFKHPWALISVIVAAILLILTFLQTLFSIIK